MPCTLCLLAAMDSSDSSDSPSVAGVVRNHGSSRSPSEWVVWARNEGFEGIQENLDGVEPKAGGGFFCHPSHLLFLQGRFIVRFVLFTFGPQTIL